MVKNSLQEVAPDIAAQWHPTKNGDLTPADVAANSHDKYWWFYPYDDPKTGKHHDFEWPARVSDRVSKHAGPPFLKGKSVWKGYNDLATVRPDVAAKWHPTKNGDIRPEDVLAGSNTSYWWYGPYDDPKTGKHFDFEWPMSPHEMCGKKGKGVVNPVVSGWIAWPGFNDVATLYPEIAAQWHPTKNGDLTPENITQGHSAENYCMTEDNIRRIFAYVDMQPDEIQEFYNSLDAFLRHYMNYFALKAAIAISYSSLLHRRNCPKEKISSLFIYDFRNDRLVDTPKMRDEMTRMNACVEENHLKELYQKILNNIGPRQKHESDELRQSRRMYLRGHNVFDYLFYYIENRARQTGKHIDRNTMAKMCAVEFDRP